METQRYHREFGFPTGYEKELSEYVARLSEITYTRHAKLETIHDRYGTIPVVRKVDLAPEQIFEIFVEGGVLVKAVFRVSGKLGLDYCYSISRYGAVVTCWTNTKDDQHQTLKKEVYA